MLVASESARSKQETKSLVAGSDEVERVCVKTVTPYFTRSDACPTSSGAPRHRRSSQRAGRGSQTPRISRSAEQSPSTLI